MSDIPSDFDPALLFSDYLPDPQSLEYPTLPIEESYSDELEAINLQIEETRERLNKQGVVIRHRQFNQQPAFRSSSLPPETPTRSSSNRQSVWNLQTSSPCPEETLRSSPITPRGKMTFNSSALVYPRSSPPPPTAPPPAKRQKIVMADDESFGYPDSDEEEALMNQGPDEEDSQPLPQALEEDAQKTPTAPQRPVFNLPLSGGIFSKKFTSTAPKTSYSRPAGRDLAVGSPPPVSSVLRGSRAELTPPPQLPPADNDSFEAFKASIAPVSMANIPIAPKSTAPTVPLSVYSSTYLPVVLSSGESFQIRQKPPRIYSTRENYYLSSISTEETTVGEGEEGGPKKSYYGVDISSLLSDYKAEKRIKAAQREDAASKAADKAADEALAAALQPDLDIPTKKVAKTLLWSEKYRAKRFTDLVGDERTHRQVLRWFKAWDKIVFPSASNSKVKKVEEGEERELRKVLLIHGPPGLGKTTLAHVVAKQAGYEVVEVNASDERSAGVVKGRVKDILSNEGVKSMGMKTSTAGGAVTLGKPVCLVVDEIDGVTGGGAANEGGFVKALIDLVMADQKASNVVASGVTRKKKGRKGDLFRLQRPIVAICNDLYAPALKMLRPLAEVVYMRKPPAGLMVGRLKSVLANEGFRVEDGAVRRLVELSCMDGSVGKAGGDMRAAMVGCEWIACRLRAAAEAEKNSKEKKYLTRKIVEEEFGDGGLGEADGKGGGGGRGSVREAVERVFYAEKEAPVRGKKDTGKRKKTNIEKLREVVEGLGEFDKIMSDCFATYLTRPYHDDTFLTKPNAAGEWLWFQDLLSAKVFTEQDYELSGYLSSPILAFHHLFSSAVRQKPTAGQGKYNHTDNEEEEEAAHFSGPQAEWEVRESIKENKALIASVHTCMNGGIRLHQAFKATETVAMELAPWVSRILSPNIKPVVVGGSGPEGGVASVRRDGEKKLVMRGVGVMVGLGVEFEKVKVEGIGSGGWGWVYRMEPPLDTLSVFRTFTLPPGDTAPAPIRYAVRQVLDQALRKALLLQREASKQARMGTTLDAPQLRREMSMAANLENMLKRKKNEVKKDFFGRVVVVDEPQIGEEGEEGGKRKKAKGKGEEKNETVWLSFHEGFSNAVRKGVTLDEFMSGLI